MSTLGLGVAVFLCGWLWKEIGKLRKPGGGDAHNTITAAMPLPPPVPLEHRGAGVSPGPYTRADLVGVTLILLLFGALTWSNLQAGEGTSTQPSSAGLWVSILLQGMIAGSVAAWVGCRFPLVEWLGLRWPRWRSVFWITPLALLAVWTLMLGIMQCGWVDWLKQLGVETSQDSVKALKESNQPEIIALMAVAAMLVAPICEEVVFRGYFYPALKHHCGAVCAAIASALVFSAAHASLVALLPLILLGLVFVWLYEKTGSIWAPVALHFAFNSATVLHQLASRWFDLPVQSP